MGARVVVDARRGGFSTASRSTRTASGDERRADSRTFGKWHALGPWLCVERGPLMLHFYARWFRLPYQHGWHWGLTFRAGRSHAFHRGGGWR